MAQEIKEENPITSIGVEIEGGFNEKPKNFHLDGSVAMENVSYVGEVDSEPISDLKEAQQWTKDNYPNWLNKTCAIHINLEIVNDEQFNRLKTVDFEKTFTQNAIMWGKKNHINTGSSFWTRLEGRNAYCTKGLDTRTRYKQLNFTNERTHIYGKNGKNIIECRLFPSFQKAKLSLSAVAFFYNLVSNYLRYSSY